MLAVLHWAWSVCSAPESESLDNFAAVLEDGHAPLIMDLIAADETLIAQNNFGLKNLIGACGTPLELIPLPCACFGPSKRDVHVVKNQSVTVHCELLDLLLHDGTGYFYRTSLNPETPD
jgi:hypothetical protein